MLASTTTLRTSVEDAIKLVNLHSGQANVRLWFNTQPPYDFIANSGTLQGDNFVFTAGFETIEGRIHDLREIRAELINRGS
ncbi:MAG: hypothetical protein CHACPFDD_02418 [Phycisphaerae bacterium]|nr:hypothetical protein [Phycisphaerae bacterium]